MKWLPVLALIIFAQQPAKPPESNRIPESAGSQISQQRKATNPNQDTPVNQDAPTAQALDRNDNASPTDENIEIQRKLVLFTGLLVVAGFITAAVIFWQSWETRKSAKAALLNAQALINSERAWIMVDIVPVPGMGERVHAKTNTSVRGTEYIPTTAIPLRMVCRNEGNVPA